MRHKLTPAFAANATTLPAATRTTYWDAGMPCFGLMVTANGHRSYHHTPPRAVLSISIANE